MIRTKSHQSQLTVICPLRDTEISDFDHSLCVDQDIISFDVSMNDPLSVKVAKALNNLTQKCGSQGLLERTPLLDETRDTSTRDVFDENIEVSVICE